jgi:hypothetical protein
MTEPELHALIERLRAERYETEWLEFKAINKLKKTEISLHEGFISLYRALAC